jgi:hypothetical protein
MHGALIYQCRTCLGLLLYFVDDERNACSLGNIRGISEEAPGAGVIPRRVIPKQSISSNSSMKCLCLQRSVPCFGSRNAGFQRSKCQFFLRAVASGCWHPHEKKTMGNQPSSRLRGPPRIRSETPNALGLSKTELDERCKPSGYVSSK